MKNTYIAGNVHGVYKERTTGMIPGIATVKIPFIHEEKVFERKIRNCFKKELPLKAMTRPKKFFFALESIDFSYESKKLYVKDDDASWSDCSHLISNLVLMQLAMDICRGSNLDTVLKAVKLDIERWS